MTATSDDLLPCDPARGVGRRQVAAAAADFDGAFYPYGMCTPEGAARVEQLVFTVERVLRAEAGREAALWTMLGGMARIERDGHGEASDIVVRGRIRAALEPACGHAEVAAFTDAEVGEVALLLSLRHLDGATSGYPKGLPETGISA